RTLGSLDFIRVPSPAARTMTAAGRLTLTGGDSSCRWRMGAKVELAAPRPGSDRGRAADVTAPTRPGAPAGPRRPRGDARRASTVTREQGRPRGRHGKDTCARPGSTDRSTPLWTAARGFATGPRGAAGPPGAHRRAGARRTPGRRARGVRFAGGRYSGRPTERCSRVRTRTRT